MEVLMRGKLFIAFIINRSVISLFTSLSSGKVGSILPLGPS